jgi:hypothetical protein
MNEKYSKTLKKSYFLSIINEKNLGKIKINEGTIKGEERRKQEKKGGSQ